jgi:hypothetical protein
MSEMEDMFMKMERKASQAAKRKLAEKRADPAHSRPKSSTKETNDGKNEKIIKNCFECGVCFAAEDPLFCIKCCTDGIVVVGDSTPIKHPSIVQVLYSILFSFLFGVVFGKENLYSFITWAIFGVYYFITWAIFGVSKHDEL